MATRAVPLLVSRLLALSEILSMAVSLLYVVCARVQGGVKSAGRTGWVSCCCGVHREALPHSLCRHYRTTNLFLPSVKLFEGIDAVVVQLTVTRLRPARAPLRLLMRVRATLRRAAAAPSSSPTTALATVTR